MQNGLALETGETERLLETFPALYSSLYLFSFFTYLLELWNSSYFSAFRNILLLLLVLYILNL